MLEKGSVMLIFWGGWEIGSRGNSERGSGGRDRCSEGQQGGQRGWSVVHKEESGRR